MNRKNGILLFATLYWMYLFTPVIYTKEVNHFKQQRRQNLITHAIASTDESLSLQAPVANADPINTTIALEDIVNLSDDTYSIGTTPQTALMQQEESSLERQKAPEPEHISDDLLPPEAQDDVIEDINLVVEQETIEFNFENANLDQLTAQISQIFNITFIGGDTIEPLAKDAKSLKGNKISFKTHNPLSRKDAWALFLSFLEMAGFAIVPQERTVSSDNLEAPQIPVGQTAIYRIIPLDKAKQAPMPTFIGTDPALLPRNDQIIRYVYFVQNNTTKSLESLVQQLKSSVGEIIALQEHNAFLFIDKSYNIMHLMEIIKELDQAIMPPTMSVLKLQRADAAEVKALYETLTKSSEDSRTAGAPARLFPSKKTSMSSYFPEQVKIIAEPVSNSLILIGASDAIKKIERFIVDFVDTDMRKPHVPLFTYQLKYADARTIADIMNEVTKFGEGSEKGDLVRAAGGVRGGDKYLRPMLFVPEEESNRVIIKATYEDYLMARDIIAQLDESQPQIAIEVLIVSIDIRDTRILGMQQRTKEPCGPNGLIGNYIKYQTSGLRTGQGNSPRGIVENPNGAGINRLLGDLIALATTAAGGNTLISLGDELGVWGVIQALQTISATQVLSNPFLLVTNKTEAEVSIGETRRVVKSVIVPQSGVEVPTFGDEPAHLTVKITPIINSDGMIVLNLDIQVDTFIGPADPNSVEKRTRQIKTQVIVAEKEVVALGGLTQSTIEDNRSKVPILGDIPLIGWLFKNKLKAENKDNILVLISTSIIKPSLDSKINNFTRKHLNDCQRRVAEDTTSIQTSDPINRWFFYEGENSGNRVLDDFFFKDPIPSVAQAEHGSKQKRRRKRNGKDDTPHTPLLPPASANEGLPSVPALENDTMLSSTSTSEPTTLAAHTKRSLADHLLLAHKKVSP
jgi:general secretion pathway protein D